MEADYPGTGLRSLSCQCFDPGQVKLLVTAFIFELYSRYSHMLVTPKHRALKVAIH